MPTLTKPRSTAAPALRNLDTLDHLHAHPTIAPLLARRALVRERLTAVNEAVRAARRELHTRDGDSFAEMSARRQLHTQLATLEEEGSALEAELHPLSMQLEVAKEQTKAALRPSLTQEGAAVTAAFLEALESLAEAGHAYAAFHHRTYRLLEAPMVPTPVHLGFLPLAIRQATETLGRLQASA